MPNANLYALFQSRLPKDPTAVFLDDRAGRVQDYASLDGATARMAGLLKAIGVTKGDRVVAQVQKSIDAVVLYLGCLRIGAIYVPLNTAYTPAEVGLFLCDAEPHLFVCTPGAHRDLMPAVEKAKVPHVLTLAADGHGTLIERAGDAEDDHDVAECAPDDVAAIVYTSGTTGRSKGAMLTHANLACNALTLHKIWGWVPGDVLLHALPIFHVHGLFVALHCALLNGSKVFFLSRFDTDSMLVLLPQSTVMMGVPTFYTRLLDDPRLSHDLCANMRLFIAGSAPLLPETFARFEMATGHRILERYGMTEAGMITSNPYQGARVPGTVGFPLPDVLTRVTDERGEPLPHGQPGVLEIKGPNVFAGYWRMPEKTAEEFRSDGYFITGDVAIIDSDGRISIVGRAKDLIISGGFNVYPKEIEGHIDAIPGVDESAVIGVPHPDFGEAVTAVVTTSGTPPVDEETIVATLADKLARFKQPKRVFFVDSLPRNAMGKVQKAQLRQAYEGTFR